MQIGDADVTLWSRLAFQYKVPDGGLCEVGHDLVGAGQQRCRQVRVELCSRSLAYGVERRPATLQLVVDDGHVCDVDDPGRAAYVSTGWRWEDPSIPATEDLVQRADDATPAALGRRFAPSAVQVGREQKSPMSWESVSTLAALQCS